MTLALGSCKIIIWMLYYEYIMVTQIGVELNKAQPFEYIHQRWYPNITTHLWKLYFILWLQSYWSLTIWSSIKRSVLDTVYLHKLCKLVHQCLLSEGMETNLLKLHNTKVNEISWRYTYNDWWYFFITSGCSAKSVKVGIGNLATPSFCMLSKEMYYWNR